MSYATWKIVHTPFEGSGYDEEEKTDLTDVTDVALRLGIGTVKDNFSIKLVNWNDEYDGYFSPKDRIQIYRALNSTVIDTVQDLLMVGTVSDYPESLTEAGRILEVKGYNYSESVLSALVFSDPVGQGANISQALQGAVTSVRNFNPNFGITWDDDNPLVKSDDTDFPLVTERFFYKTLSSLMEKYSANNFTEDGSYFWFVTVNNELYWRRRDEAIDYTFDKDTDTYVSVKEGRDEKDIVNYVIIKGGMDAKNRQIQVRVQDYSSSTRYGIKWKILVDEAKYAKDTNGTDMLIAGDSAGAFGTLPGNIPTFSYPFTTSFGLTATSDDHYNILLQTNVKDYLTKKGKAYMELRKYGKFKADITVYPGELLWGLGDNISYVYTDKLTSINKTMRVTNIQYGKLNDMYSLEEDVGTIK